MNKILSYFSQNSLLANFILVITLILGVYFWQITPKEEMPDMTWNRVMISAYWSGAAPEDMERFVTTELEDSVSGLENILSVSSTTKRGSSSISLELDEKKDFDEMVNEIRNAISRVPLPDGVDDPNIRIFKSSQKAIIDVVLYQEDSPLLSGEDRQRVQEASRALKNQLTSIPEVSSVDESGSYAREIHIAMRPDRMEYYQIPFNDLASIISSQNIRQPAGELDDKDQTLVSIDEELNSVEDLEQVVVRGKFGGKVIRLKDVADIYEIFEENDSIIKINGHESVTLRVVKSADAGIITAVDQVKKSVARFNSTMEGTGIKVLLLDDESQSVRSRLSLIAQNGGLGFAMILILLFLFLDFKSGFWVAMGIPFTFCLTMILASLLGMTINNMTLAAVIIVMGMVVDDAIIVTENISRLRQNGATLAEAVVTGTSQVVSPVIASVITTCIAFVPLFMFSGFAGRMGKVIPPIVMIMLAGSLFESLFILPSHIRHKIFPGSRLAVKPVKKTRKRAGDGHWFFTVEKLYSRILNGLLKFRFVIIPVFAILALLAVWIYKNQMNFALFPGEDSSSVYIDARTPTGTKRAETELASRKIEELLESFPEGTVESYQTRVAAGRFGSTGEENRIFVSVILPPSQKRDGRTARFQKMLQEKLDRLEGFEDLQIRAQRFGFSSGSALEILVQENDREKRELLTDTLVSTLSEDPSLTSVEANTPRPLFEYRVFFDRLQLSRLAVSASNIQSLLKTALDGKILYDFPRGNDTVEVRLISPAESRKNIDTVFNLPVKNSSGYLVPLGQLLHTEKVKSDSSIERIDALRTTTVYADPAPENEKPLMEMAEEMEQKLFPEILKNFPGSVLSFSGEVKETRQLGNELMWGIIFVLLMIYMVLALSLKSMLRPLIVMMSIPLGAAGVIFAFRLHGIATFGFYAAVGVIGLSGIVVNDSIVMLDRLRARAHDLGRTLTRREVAETAATRLRAIILTTVTTVMGLLPTAYGVLGYDALLSQMMLAISYGLIFATVITLILVPSLYLFFNDIGKLFRRKNIQEEAHA